jgi:catechol 2,3-dioxygenase-like lactoylglutathione lyase family enzyme
MMRLHHVNIVSPDVQGLDDFYRTALGLERIPDLPLIAIQGYSDTSSGEVKNPATFLSAGDPEQLQVHLCAPDQNLGFRYGHMVNPIARGHIAYRCDDIAAVKARLEASRIPYSDWGVWAVKGWYQIFLFDPAGTAIEVHQVLE